MAEGNQLVIIQPTPFCNIDCRYCYLPARADRSRITPEILERIFEQVFSSPHVGEPINILWHIGEPLSLPVEFYRSAFQQAARINATYGRVYQQSIQTNATLINDAWVALFREYNVNVAVSLDGPAFIHDRQRVDRSGRGTHHRVMQGIEHLRRANYPFGVIGVLTRFSLDYPDEIFDFYVDNGVRGVGFNMDEIEGTHQSTSYAESLAETIELYKRFMKRFLERIEESGGALAVREFQELAPMFVNNPPPSLVNNTTTPYSILNFDCFGNFQTFCPELMSAKNEAYNHFKMGNVLTGHIDQITSSPAFVRMHAEIQAGVDACRQTCAYWEVCKGGAPSAKYFQHGRFDATETITCRVTRIALTDAMLEHLEAKLRVAQP